MGNVNPLGPRSVYDEAKRFAETLTMAWRRAKAVDTGIVRLFNTYGPRMRTNDGRAVSNFFIQALEGRPLAMYGDEPRPVRSASSTRRLTASFGFSTRASGPMNIGSPDEHSVLDIARLIFELTGSRSEIAYRPLPQDDPNLRDAAASTPASLSQTARMEPRGHLA